MALRCLFPFGDIVAATFTPKDVKVVRDAMVRESRPRVTCNAVVRAICRMFKWKACEGLVPASVWHGLMAVPALKKGPECPPVEEVPEPVVVNAG